MNRQPWKNISTLILFSLALLLVMGCGGNQSSGIQTPENDSAERSSPLPPIVSSAYLIKQERGSNIAVIAVFSVTNPNDDVALWQANLDIAAKDASGKVLATNKGAMGHAQDTIPLVPPNTTWNMTNSNIGLQGGLKTSEEVAKVAKIEVNIEPKWQRYDAQRMGPFLVSGQNIVDGGGLLGQVTSNVTVPVRQVLFYATVSREGKVIGAGRDSIYSLNPGQTQSFQMPIYGDVEGELQVLALPLER